MNRHSSLPESLAKMDSTGTYYPKKRKTTIQWEKGVKEQFEDDLSRFRMRSMSPASHRFAGARGSRMSFIQDLVTKIKIEETESVKDLGEERTQQGISHLMQNFGTGFVQKRLIKNVDLTVEQEEKLQELKNTLKAENDAYLEKHPELHIMLSLVYRQLFKMRPENPKQFVADYVHYLNTHRQELVLKDIDVPFDNPIVPKSRASSSEVISLDEERLKVKTFARRLVERCTRVALYGPEYSEMYRIVESVLSKVSFSEDDSNYSCRSAESIVAGVMASLLKLVGDNKAESHEIIVNEILNSIFANIGLSEQPEKKVYIETKESVELFINNLVDSLAFFNDQLMESKDEFEFKTETDVTGDFEDVLEEGHSKELKSITYREEN